MDVGKFKTSRTRLVLWVLVPPLLAAVPAMGTYALRLRSQWELERVRKLSDVLPRLVRIQRQALVLVDDFEGSNAGAVRTEDGLISFLQAAAEGAAFMVDSLKVERGTSAGNAAQPVLVASLKGSGTFGSIQTFLGNAAIQQHLLSERSLQLFQTSSNQEEGLLRAEIVFELVIFDAAKTAVQGGRP